jgi:glycosyltransferase involved in cell wall biosynthesis
VVLHTVPARPSAHQRSVLESIVQLADASIVMSNAARRRLVEHYAVDPAKVMMIPHGAAVPPESPSPVLAGGERPSLLTWGLLGPGKGIEHAIDAVALLSDVRPRPRYTVAGVTHPKVFSMHGDAYRHSLVQRAWSSGVAASVTFDDTYRDVPTLTTFIAASSIVVLPYDSRDQVTSGVLVDAIAAGRPVVATAFPHAVELLGSGAGIVVPHGDPEAMADALGSMLADAQLLDAMGAEARRLAPSLSWASVARKYLRLADRVALDSLGGQVAM